MYADDLLLISPTPEGLQQSLNVVHKHAQEWNSKLTQKKIKCHHIHWKRRK